MLQISPNTKETRRTQVMKKLLASIPIQGTSGTYVSDKSPLGKCEWILVARIATFPKMNFASTAAQTTMSYMRTARLNRCTAMETILR